MKTKVTVTYVRCGPDSVPWAEGIYSTSYAEFAVAKAIGPGGVELKTCARALDPQALAFVSDGNVLANSRCPTMS